MSRLISSSCGDSLPPSGAEKSARCVSHNRVGSCRSDARWLSDIPNGLGEISLSTDGEPEGCRRDLSIPPIDVEAEVRAHDRDEIGW
jgi:hypothetical protein